MARVMISLAALIAAISFVTIANATMTTIMPLQMLRDGADETMVALFGAAYFLGFTVGCFSEPPRILRVGYIRAFAAAAAACTTLAILIDFTASPVLWIVLRFLMGLGVAAIFASVDGWINAATPDALRGRVFSIYGWCIGASAVLGQLMLLVWDALAFGFITFLALAFNAAVMLVTLTRATAPSARQDLPAPDPANPVRSGTLAITSGTAVVAAVYAGLVTTAILAILPALLAGEGVDDGTIGLVIAAFFIGRLVFQIPIGVIADRMDLRLLIAVVALLTAATMGVGSLLVAAGLAQVLEGAGTVQRALFLVTMAIAGGLILPLYTVANSLAFARAGGQPAVRIATTLLLVNSAGAVAGPMLVAVALPVFGAHALTGVIVLASGLTAGFALYRRSFSATHAPTRTGLSEVAGNSLAMAEAQAEIRAAEMAETAPDPTAASTSPSDGP